MRPFQAAHEGFVAKEYTVAGSTPPCYSFEIELQIDKSSPSTTCAISLFLYDSIVIASSGDLSPNYKEMKQKVILRHGKTFYPFRIDITSLECERDEDLVVCLLLNKIALTVSYRARLRLDCCFIVLQRLIHHGEK